MPDFLAEMAAASAARAHAARRRRPEAELRRRALAVPPAPALRLHPSGFDLIAEIKYRSPSRGQIAPEESEAAVAARAAAYAGGGAAAVSVVTEPSAFDGALTHLAAAAHASRVPTLRKDFLVDPYQVLEARAAGAGGVLLIVRLVGPERLAEMLATAAELGLFVLLEVSDEDDLAQAGAATARHPSPLVLLGVNARDLGRLSLDHERHALLARQCPAGAVRVAESGIADLEGARRVARLGYRLALVGEALMRAPDPRGATEALIAAGRGAAEAPCASE